MAIGAGVLGLRFFYAHPAQARAWFKDLRRPLIMAHQGGEKQWPSNTMLAFRQARALGADVLDMDVHLSKDGQLVLMHDVTVDRTTDGHGAIRDKTWSELSRLDAGYGFSLDGKTYPYRGRGLRIPRLEEVLQEFPDIRLGIEIKQAPLATANHLAVLIRRYGAQDRVLLAGFDATMIKEQRRLMPELASTATPAEVRLFWMASALHLESFTAADYAVLQIPLEHEGRRLVTPRLVEAAHNRGIAVLPWTLDSDQEVEQAKAAGCDGFNTNLPGPMSKFRQSWPR
ncbi:glycerophosphodiester phosphodiesterase [bacterium]|nr:glycerophosphodiester phosphodiesterase [bacterium]